MEWIETWVWMSWSEALGVVVSAAALYGMIGVLVRVFGLRSFAKLTAFDAAVTVAIGSILATAITAGSPTLLVNALALLSLFGLQAGISSLRRVSPTALQVIENKPALVFTRGRFLRTNMVRASLTESDVWAKLREANALQPDDVYAVIVETTGDVSVLHGDEALDPRLLEGVRDGEQATG